MSSELARDGGTFRKQILALVVPIAIQQFMQALINATDAIMLGLVEQTSLSAVSLAGQIQVVLTIFVLPFVQGGSILAAQYWGRRDEQTISRVMAISLRLSALAGLAVTLAAALFPQALMTVFTNDPEIIARGAAYVRAVSPSYLLYALSAPYLSTLQSTGRAAVSSRINSVAVVVNIALNAVLIFGLFGAPRLEIVGAAIATAASRALELAWAVIETRRPQRVKLHWADVFRSQRAYMADFWRNFVPVFVAGVVYGGGMTMYSIILGHMGNDCVAANSIATILRTMLFCVCRGVSTGSAVLVGNVLGAGVLELAKDYGRRLCHLAILFGAVTGGLVAAFSPLVVRLVPLSDAARGYLQAMLLFNAVYTLARSVNATTLSGIFAAGGDLKIDAQLNAVAMWLIAIPLGALGVWVFRWPVMAVYCIVNLDEIVKLPFVYFHYKKYVWLKDLTQKTSPTQ